MWMSRSEFRIVFLLLCVSPLSLLFYFFQYSTTITRFQEFHKFCSDNDIETCLSFDVPFLFEIAVIGTSVVYTALLLKSYFNYLYEANPKNWPVFCWRLVDCVDYPIYARITLLLFLCLLSARFMQGYGFLGIMECPILVLGLAGLAYLIQMCLPYDDVDLSYSVNLKNSIGAAYAYGACNSYYDIVLRCFISCVKEWEKKNEKSLSVKELIVICPLSCDVNGDLKDRCKSNVEVISEFVSHIGDQAANMNRKYKHTIYEINSSQDGCLVTAEFASPLGVLWEKGKELTSKEEFIRDCFIFTLKNYVQSKRLPCTVVEWDENRFKYLEVFLLSVVEGLTKCSKVKEV